MMMSPAPEMSDEALRRAGKITLIDPARPGWCMPLSVHFLDRRPGVEITIPVNSQDGVELNEWRKRIARLHLLD